MRRRTSGVFTERVVNGIDDGGAPERIVIWIERRPGAVWAVGRAVNPEFPPDEHTNRGDWVFEGYELDDALEHANAALHDDLRVSVDDGRNQEVPQFAREELLKPLERWFFGR